MKTTIQILIAMLATDCLAGVIATAQSQAAQSQAAYQEQNGIVVIEAENTDSPLGRWQTADSISGYTGDGYLNFTGNDYLHGPADSPLRYTFTIKQSGLYFLHLLCARETQIIDGETRKDVANDCYVRVEGDFQAGPNAGDQHGDNATLAILKKDTKFFGGDDRAFVWASGNHLDPGGHENKRVAAYRFKAGQTYDLVVSGRSKAFKLDRIVFRLKKVHPNNAENRGASETLANPDRSQISNRINPPNGRIAVVADGNSPDPDDIGATAVILGLLDAADLTDRLVHLSHSCDLQPASRISAKDEQRRQKVLDQVCQKGIEYFGPFDNLRDYFNCRTEQQAAIDDLRDAINQSSSADPLWIIEAGEPDIIGYALKAAKASSRKHVHVVSHHPANDNSGDVFEWNEILRFNITEHQIGDQNIGLQSTIPAWDWAKDHSNASIRWIWKQLQYAEQDGVVKFQTNKFDCSDAGMVYWWITGANQNANRFATTSDIKNMLIGR